MIEVLGAEELAQNGDLGNAGNFAHDLRRAMIQQAGDNKALAVTDFDLGLGTACRKRRNGVAGNVDRVAVIQRADLRREFQMDNAVRARSEEHTSELQSL